MQEKTQFLEEQLSAIIDGEASELEVRRFCQQLETLEPAARQQLQQRWDRYHRISAGLQGQQAAAQASGHFAAGVAAKIADEPAASVPAIEAPRERLPRSQIAIAASVALAVIVGFQQYHISNQTEALRLARAEQPGQNAGLLAGASPAQPLDSSATALASLESSELDAADEAERAEAQARLQEYLLEHANHAAQQNAQGIVPFARVANFETE